MTTWRLQLGLTSQGLGKPDPSQRLCYLKKRTWPL